MSPLTSTPQQEKQAFDTHYNYADCLSLLTQKASLTLKANLNENDLTYLGTKENLINLTNRSLEDEYKIVQIDRDYSYASTSWLPIKGYYLIFNMMLTIDYILTGKRKSFSLSHNNCGRLFTSRLECGELQFNNSLLNQVFDGEIFRVKELTGANLSKKISLSRRYQMAMRKVSYYKLDEWKRLSNVNLRTKSGKAKKNAYINSFRISIFEFPYYMRIRSNYRDFAFIEGVSTANTKVYFETYYSLIKNLFAALDNFKNDLIIEMV